MSDPIIWPTPDTLRIWAAEKHLPDTLVERVLKRYREHAEEYATKQIDPDTGFPVNACMLKDNLPDIEEELVDAVFNALIHCHRKVEGQYLLERLGECWRIVQSLMEEEQ